MASVILNHSAQATIPATAGIGLRSRHYQDVLNTKPAIGWLEVHSENYLAKGGAPLHFLQQIRRDYPVSLHGVSLSLGSTDKIDRSYLDRLKALIARIEPGLVSEHLSWSAFGGQFLNDLAPMPYTADSLALMAARISAVQDFLGRRILIENPSSYLEYKHSTYPEYAFLNALAERSGCGILLDINNVYVSCRNHGWNALEYIHGIRGDWVGEMHLAGHTLNRIDGHGILIDTHNCPVSEPVWDLFKQAIRVFGPRPVLVEWDLDIPELNVLTAQAGKAGQILRGRHDHSA